MSMHDLLVDADEMPMAWDPEIELRYKVAYYINKLQLNTIDALLHRVTDDAVLKWLNSGPRPRKSIPLSLGSRSYLTCRIVRSIEAAEESSSPTQAR